MHKISAFLLFVFLISNPLSAQVQPTEEQLKSINTMVEGYNNMDYKMMKKPWGFLGKVIIPKKSMEKVFKPPFLKYGTATIDTIVCPNMYMCRALLSYENDLYKRGFLKFLFNDNGKVQGFGDDYPILVYPGKKASSNQLSNAQKSQLIDSLIQKRHQSAYPFDFNGCVLAMKNDQIIYKNCFGNSNFETNTPLNDSSRILLASCSKQFTAMGIMLLEEEGKLNLKDSIQQFFPDFPYHNISIENLLTHTSGLPDYMPLFNKHWDRSKIARNQDVINVLIANPTKVKFKPNDRFEYSNTGYVLLASIIEQVSGQAYGKYLKKQIFNPLGMNQTVVVARRLEGAVPSNYAYGYVYDKDDKNYHLPDSLDNYDYVIYQDGIVGDDGVSASINDLAIWTEALKSNELFSEKMMKKAWSPHYLNDGDRSNYGYGFFLSHELNKNKLIYHTGGWPGYSILIMQFIESGETVVVLSNNDYNGFLNLADQIMGTLIYR